MFYSFLLFFIHSTYALKSALFFYSVLSNTKCRNLFFKLRAKLILFFLSNPKTTIFYLSYLPQFISETSQNISFDLLVLRLTFALLTFLAKLPIGYLAGVSAPWIQTHTNVQRIINKISGLVLIALAIYLLAGASS